MITRRESKEIIDFVIREIRRQTFSYVTDGKVDFSKITIGTISGMQYSGGQMSNGAVWNRHVATNADIRGTKVRIATTSERGTAEFAEHNEEMAGLAVQADDPRLLPSGGDFGFIDLPDTPNSYATYSGYTVKVNDAEDALEWVPSSAPGAHQTTHSPNDGTDALDCAAPAEISVVVAASEGSADTLARADHVHAINHAITDNHLLTVDGVVNSGEYLKATTNGAEGKTYAEALTDLFSVDIPEQITFTLDDVLSADGKFCVTMALNGTAGETIEFGESVYFKAGDSKWWLAKGDAEATISPMTGLVIVAGAAEAAIKVALMGEVRADAAFPALTIGAPVFIDPDTSGLVTTTKLTTGEYQKAIGWAKTSNVVVLIGNTDWVKVQ